MVAAVFGFRTCGTGEVGEDHIEKELGVLFTGAGRLRGSSGLQERQRYWYGGTGSLGSFFGRGEREVAGC